MLPSPDIPGSRPLHYVPWVSFPWALERFWPFRHEISSYFWSADCVHLCRVCRGYEVVRQRARYAMLRSNRNLDGQLLLLEGAGIELDGAWFDRGMAPVDDVEMINTSIRRDTMRGQGSARDPKV